MKIVLAFALTVVACGGDAQKPVTSPNTATTATAAPTASTPASTERKPAGANLTVSEEIFRLCNLQAQSDAQVAPKFAFDATLITREDAIVLDKIAVCLTTGPLAKRRTLLTGRTDSRGTQEYNLTLGARRAHGVATYLEQHKVTEARLNETSRGALDATGADEATYAQDRRVDIALIQ